MTSETLGKIYTLIQQDYTKAALALHGEKIEKRKLRADILRANTEIFKHDVCMFVDAELQKARYLLEGDDTLHGRAFYPSEPERLEKITTDGQTLAHVVNEKPGDRLKETPGLCKSTLHDFPEEFDNDAEILYNQRAKHACDCAGDSNDVIMLRVLATLEHRTRLILGLLGFLLGVLLALLFSGALF